MSQELQSSTISISEVFELTYEVSSLQGWEGIEPAYGEGFKITESGIFLRSLATALAKRATNQANDFTVRRMQDHLTTAPHGHQYEYYGNDYFGITFQQYMGITLDGTPLSADALTLTSPQDGDQMPTTRIVRLDDGSGIAGPETVAVRGASLDALLGIVDGLNRLVDEHWLSDAIDPLEREAGSPILRLITSVPDA